MSEHDAGGPTASRGPADDVCARLSAALDDYAALDLRRTDDLAALLDRLTTLQRRVDSAVLETVAVFDARQTWQRDGAASAGGWLRANLRLAPGAARQQVRTARRLGELPAMRAALAEGAISREHVQVVTAAMKRNPARRESITAAETTFAAAARDLDPAQLARTVLRWTHLVDPMGAAEAECAVHEQRYLSISTTFDGAVKLDALLAPEQGALVRTALEAVATGSCRRDRAASEEDDSRTPRQRRADALVDLSRQFLDSGRSGEIAGVRPHLLVTVTAGALTSGEGEAGHRPAELDGVGPVSARTARRIGCDADVTLLRLDPSGAPLDLGRTRRTVDTRLRKALVVRDGGCRFPGCDRPPAWCEAHHIVFWSRGGRTDRANVLLLCAFHHHRVHDDGFAIRGCPQAGTVTFHRPDGTRITDNGRDGPGAERRGPPPGDDPSTGPPRAA